MELSVYEEAKMELSVYEEAKIMIKFTSNNSYLVY
jgi:hypothetical protein